MSSCQGEISNPHECNPHPPHLEALSLAVARRRSLPGGRRSSTSRRNATGRIWQHSSHIHTDDRHNRGNAGRLSTLGCRPRQTSTITFSAEKMQADATIPRKSMLIRIISPSFRSKMRRKIASKCWQCRQLSDATFLPSTAQGMLMLHLQICKIRVALLEA